MGSISLFALSWHDSVKQVSGLKAKELASVIGKAIAQRRTVQFNLAHLVLGRDGKGKGIAPTVIIIFAINVVELCKAIGHGNRRAH